MSYTIVPSANLLTVWAKESWINTVYQSAFGTLSNSGVVYRPKEFDGKDVKGQNLVYTYISRLQQVGLGEGSTLDGNEEALNIGNFQMQFGMTRLGVLNPNDDDTVEAMRTNIDFEMETRPLIEQAAAQRLDYAIFNQLAGNTATSLTLEGVTFTGSSLNQATGLNTVTAPSVGRIVRAGSVAGDENLTAANRMTLSLVDYAAEIMANSNQQIGYLENGKLGQLWISYEQLTDLKQDVDSPITWYNNALAMAAGGDSKPLTGPLYYRNNLSPVGTYAGVDIYVHPRVSYGVNSSTNVAIPTVRRAVLVGRNGISFVSRFGKGRNTDTKVPLVFKSQLKDYEYWKGMEGRMIYGMKKNTPSNGTDIGVVVISTYAAAHA